MASGKTKTKVDLSVVGGSGLKQYGGYIFEEQHPRLRGIRGPRLYKEMADNDAVIGAVLYVIRTWATQASWRAEPADESPEAADWATFIETAKDDCSHTWTSFISQIFASTPVYGWSLFETCYKRRNGRSDDPTQNSAYDDGYIGWRKFSIRGQDTLDKWEFDEDGGVQGMWQTVPNKPGCLFIPIAKSLLFRTEVYGDNPEGRSMLRPAFRSWWMVKRIQEIEAVGIERDLAGYPKMQVPLDLFSSTAGVDEKANLARCEKLVTDIRRDEREGAVVPSELDEEGMPTGYKLELMTTGGQRAINIDQVVRRYESRMAMTMLCEFILLGSDKTGSFSMHASKTDVFAVSLRTMLKNVEDVINRYAVARLCAINGCPVELTPKLVVGEVAPPPLGELGAFVQQVASAGMLIHDDATERALREVSGLPEKTPDDTGVMLDEDGEPYDDGSGADAMPAASQQTATEEGDASDGVAVGEGNPASGGAQASAGAQKGKPVARGKPQPKQKTVAKRGRVTPSRRR